MDSIYQNAHLYDLLFGVAGTEETAFYERQIRRFGKRVLELGCGAGRLTIPLAKSGIDIIGIDVAQSMLDAARAKAKQQKVDIDFYLGDVRNFSLMSDKFDVIFFPNNSLSHLLDLDDISACFANVRKHLAKDGRFIVEVFNPSLSLLLRDANQRYPIRELEENGRHLVVTENSRYDSATQINHIVWYYKYNDANKEVAVHLEMRQFFPQELNALLNWHDFTIEAKYGNYDETPFSSQAIKQLLVCHADAE